jgi:GT2 family glycosyltransferase/glycosyltransferase involved in cell wall biosynthesis
MSSFMADARFLADRALGLARRGWISLRTRGIRASWARLHAQFARGAAPATPPWLPPVDTVPAFQPQAAPRASIVIPVFDQLHHTRRCLQALSAQAHAASFEVIVVDDGSGDGTEAYCAGVAGLRYHRRASNGGFIAACNDGAVLARGEFLVFLNNDTVPQPGWLDALLRTFDAVPGAGLVGAQLVFPNGTLQESGGVVFADGSGWNYGRGGSPNDPRHAYLRDSDYVSGAAIAIRRGVFERLGGFDVRYAPAYYEDTDLAFAVRGAGLRVLVQPAAKVVHDEGGTAGTDVRVGPKAAQVRNQQVFREHRAAQLAAQPPPGTIPSPATLHRGQRQILVIDALTPQPDHDSGSLRMVNLMQLLHDGGAHVAFLPANREHAGRYTEVLQEAGVECWYAPFGGRAPAWLREHGRRFHTVVVCRHYVLREFLPLLRRHAPQAKIVFDTVDLHYLRERRGARLAADATLMRAADSTKARELDLIARSDVTLEVSEAERALLATDAPDARVEVLSNLHQLAGPGGSFASRRDLVFVGGFRHPPNVAAVRWFALEVFPRVRARLPDVRFHVIGSHVTAEIETLGALPGVVVHGHVPDITPYMDGCRIGLAPLRYGAGVKGKVNLSMAHGQPVVATSCAVEGMHLEPGRDVLVADDARGFSDAVVELYGNEALWVSLGENGLRNVAEHFSLDAARETVRRVFFA